MDRPDLVPADLEEVDRLLALATAAGKSLLSTAAQPSAAAALIQKQALLRAADILGVAPPAKQDTGSPGLCSSSSSGSSSSKPPKAGKKK